MSAPVRITLEIPADKYALMQGVAGWYEKSVTEWIDEWLTSALKSDLECTASEQSKADPIRLVADSLPEKKGAPPPRFRPSRS